MAMVWHSTRRQGSGTAPMCSLTQCPESLGRLGRLTQYLAADRAETWHMVVADDYHPEAGGTHCRLAPMFLILCSTVGAPLFWHKTSGGGTVVSVRFELLQTRHLGMAQRRAEWFTKWARETTDSEWEDHVGMSPRTGTTLPRTLVQVHAPHPAVDEKGSSSRQLHPASLRRPSRPDETLQLCRDFGKHTGGTKSQRAGQRREDRNRRLVLQMC